MKNTLRIASLLLVLAMCVVAFASCGMDTYQKRLEDAGYKVEVADEKELEDLNKLADGKYEVKASLAAMKDLNGVTIVQFANKKQAEEQAEDAKKVPGMTVEVKGKFVIAGTEDAVKAALGK